MEASDEECGMGKRLEIEVEVGSPRFLNPQMTEREGSLPQTHSCLPHYQIDQNPSPEIFSVLYRKIFVNDETKDCCFDGATGPLRSLISLPNTLAMQMKDGVPYSQGLVGREFSHLHHEGDGSLHLVLSNADAAVLFAKKRGERHLMAGKMINGKSLCSGLVMVYAPRTLEEIDIVMEIVKAGYQFARGDFAPAYGYHGE